VAAVAFSDAVNIGVSSASPLALKARDTFPIGSRNVPRLAPETSLCSKLLSLEILAISLGDEFRRLKSFLACLVVMGTLFFQVGCSMPLKQHYAFLNPLNSIDVKIRAVYEANIEHATKAIELNPKYAADYYERAFFYSKLGKFEEASRDFAKAVKLNPEYFFIFMSWHPVMPNNDMVDAAVFNAFFGVIKASQHYGLRHKAAEVFVCANNAKFIDLVIPKLKDPSWQARETAILFLGKLSAKFDKPELAKVLIPMLRDINPQVRKAAAGALKSKDKRILKK
jgi:tetratricopeptide (TPR) repeat protein